MGPSTQAERWDLACCLRRVPSVSACAMLPLSWLNLPPHPITVYASHPPSPTTTQHSLPGGALPPYRSRSFTGRTASASPHAPELRARIRLPPSVSQLRTWPRRGGPTITSPRLTPMRNLIRLSATRRPRTHPPGPLG